MSFNLETAISAWRYQFKYQRFMLNEDLDELERHLRDVTCEYIEKGLDEAAAFHTALTELGDFGGTDAEYRKVYWGKLKRRHRVLNEIGWGISMFRNYVRIALRVIYKQKLYAAINVFGLAFGLACFLLIVRYVHYELSYDRFHSNADQVHRAVYQSPGDMYLGTDYFAGSPMLLASTLLAEYPEVTHATTLRNYSSIFC